MHRLGQVEQIPDLKVLGAVIERFLVLVADVNRFGKGSKIELPDGAMLGDRAFIFGGIYDAMAFRAKAPIIPRRLWFVFFHSFLTVTIELH